MSVDLRHGDSLAVLPTLDTASVDAIVTDPPYGLEFMGRAWDDAVPGVDIWAECLRVLKPGGHLLAFGGTRTVHRLACAVEDAGFEIRDQIAWLYGSGFPKSLDVGKAIDKMRDDKSDILQVTAFVRAARDRSGMRNADVDAALGVSAMCDHWCRASPLQAQVPTWEQWLQLSELLGFGDELDAEVWRLNARKGTPGEAWEQREIVGHSGSGRRRESSWNPDGAGSGVFRINDDGFDVTAAATPDAVRWSGWGTALKPAQEPIIVARKPLAGTVAANVLAHGTGAIHVDACRVGTTVETWPKSRSYGTKAKKFDTYEDQQAEAQSTGDAPPGRWPANVVMVHAEACAEGACVDGCPVAELDSQSGTSTSVQGDRRGASRQRSPMGVGVLGPQDRDRGRGDTGGASRFYPTFRYHPKAPASERPKIDGKGWPTVKPLGLMRWLVRLVTPPGGVVLDPFAGTGATLQAARAEGFDAIGVERDEFAYRLARQRLDPAPPTPDVPAALFDLDDTAAS